MHTLFCVNGRFFMEEKEVIKRLIEVEDIAGKKAGVYAKLLTEPSLAKAMEKTATEHKEREQAWQALLGEEKK